VRRLEELEIQLVADGPAVKVYARGQCIAAVGGTQGGTGLTTDRGLAYLVWRGGRAFLSAKGCDTPATAEEVETIRRFSEDLKTALGT
jgi:hypothetical protein